MAKKYLDYNGLQYFWQKIKSIIPNFTSDLTNDSGFVTTDDDIEWVDVDASNAKNTTLIENGTIVYPNTVKEAVYGLEEELNKKEVTIGSTPDEDAVLWIEPDGDVTTPIYAPNTAQVGQTIVVSAVDENSRPTAWEAVDMPQGGGTWKHLHSIDLADTYNVQLPDIANYNSCMLFFVDGLVTTRANTHIMLGATTSPNPPQNRIATIGKAFDTVASGYTASWCWFEFAEDGTLVWSVASDQYSTNMYFNSSGFQDGFKKLATKRTNGEGISIIIESSGLSRGHLEVYVK